MVTFETIELGFDIATAISIIGAAFVYIHTTSRENTRQRESIQQENRKQLQNEKVKEILDLLAEFRAENFDVISKMIDEKGNIGPILTDIAKFLRIKMLPTFAIFAIKEIFDELEKIIDATDTAIDEWDDFCKITDKDKKANDGFTEAMSKYVNSMMRLDFHITKNLRNQVHDENKTISKEISESYQKRKYTYRVVEFK